MYANNATCTVHVHCITVSLSLEDLNQMMIYEDKLPGQQQLKT